MGTYLHWEIYNSNLKAVPNMGLATHSDENLRNILPDKSKAENCAHRVVSCSFF